MAIGRSRLQTAGFPLSGVTGILGSTCRLAMAAAAAKESWAGQ